MNRNYAACSRSLEEKNSDALILRICGNFVIVFLWNAWLAQEQLRLLLVQLCNFCRWRKSPCFVADELVDASSLFCSLQAMRPGSGLFGLRFQNLFQTCSRQCWQLLSERLRCSELKTEWCWLWLARYLTVMAFIVGKQWEPRNLISAKFGKYWIFGKTLHRLKQDQGHLGMSDPLKLDFYQSTTNKPHTIPYHTIPNDE